MYSSRKGVIPENFSNFFAYAKHLEKKCVDGPTTYLKWKPSKDLIGKPVYYQV